MMIGCSLLGLSSSAQQRSVSVMKRWSIGTVKFPIVTMPSAEPFCYTGPDSNRRYREAVSTSPDIDMQSYCRAEQATALPDLSDNLIAQVRPTRNCVLKMSRYRASLVGSEGEKEQP